jgi:hypothetical protein
MLGENFLQTRADLGTALLALGTLAHDLHAPEETIRTLNELGTSLREPFLFVVAGEVKAGKSSLLNALFGREFCKVDVLPATDKIYVFKHADEERDVPVSAQLTECYRNSPVLRDFNIVDTPGTNTIHPEHEAITRQFLPLADLCLCVFSATNPWGATAWQFLQHLHRNWVKKVIFILQQRDLRSPAEIESIMAHMNQTMVAKIGESCPIFAVSAKLAWEAKHAADSGHGADLWRESGFGPLEKFISESVTGGGGRPDKLRSVCQSARVISSDFSQQVSSAMDVVRGDLKKLADLRGVLAERMEQSFRQIGGVLWTIAQTSERTQQRGEELLREKLTLGQTMKLVFGGAGWKNYFQSELETRQRETVARLVRESIEVIEADLKSVWQQVRELMQRGFSEHQSPLLPDFARQRKELLERLDAAVVERSQGAEFQQQMQRHFSDAATWLRVPAGMFAAGGIAAAVAGAMANAMILDITGTIAAVGALTGTVVAVANRRKIIGAYRKQMTEKRDSMVQGIEDHLKHAVKRFYIELEQMFQPFEAFCAGQKKLVEPSFACARYLEVKLGQCATALGMAGEANR